MGAWNNRAFGSLAQPVHKSHLNQLTGPYGCPKRFWYEQTALWNATIEEAAERVVYASAATGTAVHEAIYRALKSEPSRKFILGGGRVSREQVARVYMEELQRELGGRTVDWRGEDPDEVNEDRIAMIVGLLAALPNYVAAVEMVEGAFISQIDGYWIAGHCDLVYRPRANPEALAFADWKTGGQKPDQITLDHGWEAGFYAAALHSGLFIEREECVMTKCDAGWRAQCFGYEVIHASHFRAERDCLELALCSIAKDGVNGLGPRVQRFDQFPTEIYTVQLADYVPYAKAGTKKLTRPEDIAYYATTPDTPERPRYTNGGSVKYYADEQRGPAWLPVRVAAHDLPRLASRLRKVLGMVRMGQFVDLVSERCKRCPFSQPCLNSGYEPRGAEQLRLREVLRVLPREALAAAEELSD
jgi:hypothetical protein